MILTYNNKIVMSGNKMVTTDTAPEPVGPTIHHYPLMTAGDEYGWQLPIDVLLNAETNGLIINISFYTNESDDTDWEGGYYMANPDETWDYQRWVEMSDIRPEVVSPGYRECTVTNTMLVDGLTENIDWLNDLKDNGYTYVFTHPAAFQTYKFTSEPNADFIFED